MFIICLKKIVGRSDIIGKRTITNGYHSSVLRKASIEDATQYQELISLIQAQYGSVAPENS